VPFRVVLSNADETLLPGENGLAAAQRLARAKAEVVAGGETLPVLAADTLVVCEGTILGKPASAAEAASMLRRLSGRRHQVVTGLCFLHQGRAHSGTDVTEVDFAVLTEAEIAWYVATGEPLDKAGAYHVDGQGALFIEAVHGSPSNVAGLPIRLLLTLARQAGVRLGFPVEP
jgi:septum formation protein